MGKTEKREALKLDNLAEAAKDFCQQESGNYKAELFGVTDGKAIGTMVEHAFQEYLAGRFDMSKGNSANGLDLPSVNTDIKVTSISLPQSSCPFKDSKQKIYGLGYNLIVFVYEKHDDGRQRKGMLNFLSCTLIEACRTADYQITTGLNRIIDNNGNADDIFAFLSDHKIPADEVTLMNMAKDILNNPPQTGYLTISNALQWRLQYGRVVNLDNPVSGIRQIVRYSQGHNNV